MMLQEEIQRRVNFQRTVYEEVQQRWEQLAGLQDRAISEGIDYLFYVNGSAAVAVLAFIGSGKITHYHVAIWGLILFGVGISLIGVFRLRYFYFVERIYRVYRAEIKRYLAKLDQKIFSDEYNELVSEYHRCSAADDQRSEKDFWLEILAWGSFLCFLLGVIVLSVGFLVAYFCES